MFVFGTAVSDRDMYARVALPSIERLTALGSEVWTREGFDSIQAPYNEMLGEASEAADLDALILLHQDVELLDDSLLRRVRPLLEQPDIGVVGIFGGRQIPFHMWSETKQLYGRSVTPTVDVHHSRGAHEVEVVDGVLLVIAPWVVRSIRFSAALAEDFHGYDVDFSQRVRAAGGRVVCSDVPYFHHMSRPWSDTHSFRRAGARLAAMWDPALRPPEWAASFDR